jgi:hypothetical protein
MGKHGGRAEELAVDKYRSDVLLNPKSRAVKEKYFKVYEEYILTHATERQIAEKYGYSMHHVSRIIKWVVSETDKGDMNTYYQVMIDKLSMALQQLEMDNLKAETIKEKMSVRGEIRRHLKLVAQVQKLLRHDINIDMSDKSKTLTVVTEFDRGNHLENNKDAVNVEPEPSQDKI